MPDNTRLDIDVAGYIVNPADWSEALASSLAADEALELTDAHWQVLCFMRDYWQLNRVAPDVRHVTRHLVEKHGFNKKLQNSSFSACSLTDTSGRPARSPACSDHAPGAPAEQYMRRNKNRTQFCSKQKCNRFN
jgi:TusE/DsrC/DsvC family sulfur relay protein